MLALLSLPGIGPKKALRLALFREQFEKRLGDSFEIWHSRRAEIESDLDRHTDHNVVALSLFDQRYPKQLRTLKDPPLVLFVRGSISALESSRTVAVVGTREPTRFGCSATEEIVETLAEDNWVVASGLAKGVDTIAHGAALKHHTRTIAVLATGLDRTYPAENKELANAVADQDGALVTEYEWGAQVRRSNFVNRNRLQSGLSTAVIVTQSGLQGGTMHTVRHAATQGKPIFCAVPHAKNEKNEALFALLDKPARDLWKILPAWRDSRALCSRLGSEPLAKPITKENLGELSTVLLQLADDETSVEAHERWWPGFRPPSEIEEPDQVAPEREGATLFLTVD